MPSSAEQFACLVKMGVSLWTDAQLRAAVRAMREMLAQRKKCRPRTPAAKEP